MKLAAPLAAAALIGVGGTVTPAVPSLPHVVVIVLENHSYGQIVGSPAAPQFNRLAARGALLTRYDALAHPSLPNYLALVSGSTQGITDDCTACSVDAPSIAGSLEARGKTWKAYAEGIPRPGFAGAEWEAGGYAKRHVPFLYFRGIAAKAARRDRVVGFDALRRDLAENTLPDFALVVPDLCHDLHDCAVAKGDRWLGRFVPPLLSSRALGGGIVVVVFDEGSGLDHAGGGGHVAAMILGKPIRPGARSSARTGHYGLLRTIEDALGLPYLGWSAKNNPIVGIWR